MIGRPSDHAAENGRSDGLPVESQTVTADLALVTRQFGVQLHQVTPVGGGFSSASVFRIEDDLRQLYALRRIPVTAADTTESLTGRIRDIQNLLTGIHQNEETIIPRQIKPIRNASSQRGMEFRTRLQPGDTTVLHDAAVWQMESWLDGCPITGIPNENQLISASAALHRFHGLARKQGLGSHTPAWLKCRISVSPGVLRRIDIVNQLQNGLLQMLDKTCRRDPDVNVRMMSERLCPVIGSHLKWLRKSLLDLAGERYELQPVIRDLWRAHVLFRGDAVSGLIDFSAMATDHVALDMTRLLRSWFRSDTKGMSSAIGLFLANRQEASGREIRPLLIALDAASVLLSPVTWLKGRVNAGHPPKWSPEILARLTELTHTAESFQPVEL